MAKTTVSVIVPTYNRCRALGRALGSVRAQTYSPLEVIVVDDASKDDTSHWVRTNCPEFRLISLEQNGGAAAARNAGIMVATGEFIAFLDDDDAWLPKFVERQVAHLDGDENAVLSYCSYGARWKETFWAVEDVRPALAYKSKFHYLLTECFIHSMSLVAVKREALMQAGPLKPELRVIHDLALYARLMTQGALLHLPEVLVERTAPEESLVANLSAWEEEEREYLKVVMPECLSDSQQRETFVYRACFFASLSLKKQYCWKFTLEMIWRALRQSPYLTLKILLSKAYLRLS